MDTALTHEIEITLEASLMFANGAPIRVLATRIYENESDLIARVQRQWIIDRLVWMLHRKQQHMKNQGQMVLPGFESLPRRLTLQGGRRFPLRRAGVEVLLDYRKVLIQRRDQRLATLDKLITLLRSYAKEKNDPTITVAEVFSLEVAKGHE